MTTKTAADARWDADTIQMHHEALASERRIEAERVACEPCGMPLHVADIVTHSPAWYRIHKERHVAAFPRLDGRTIRALNDCIRYAEEAAR